MFLAHLVCWVRFLMSSVMRFGHNVRLAHAFRSTPAAADTSDLAEVLSILNGTQPLAPRRPADATAVEAAERLLRIRISSPPLYVCRMPAPETRDHRADHFSRVPVSMHPGSKSM